MEKRRQRVLRPYRIKCEERKNESISTGKYFVEITWNETLNSGWELFQTWFTNEELIKPQSNLSNGEIKLSECYVRAFVAKWKIWFNYRVLVVGRGNRCRSCSPLVCWVVFFSFDLSMNTNGSCVKFMLHFQIFSAIMMIVWSRFGSQLRIKITPHGQNQPTVHRVKSKSTRSHLKPYIYILISGAWRTAFNRISQTKLDSCSTELMSH